MGSFRGLLVVACVVAALTAAGIANADSPFDVLQISTDPYANITSQHETEVEPDTFAYGNTVVAAFQAGRFVSGGGASNIGFATSTNAGQTWTSGFLPSLTIFSSPAGPATRATDPSVAYDSTHGVWLINTLNCQSDPCLTLPTQIKVSRSTNGTSWGSPITVSTGNYDKNWIVCDNWAASPFKGRCYAAWTDLGTGAVVSTSTDGGMTWSAPVAATGIGLGVQPIVQPDGDLIVVGLTATNMGAVRSSNGGGSFGALAKVAATVPFHAPTGMRALPIPSVEVDASGTIYAVWSDCRFRTGCSSNDVVMSTSTTGTSWSAVTRIPIDKVNSGVDHFIPAIAVDSATSGSEANLAITYYYFPSAGCSIATCSLNVGFTSSNNAGGRWTHPKRLNSQAMALSWIANTDIGRMVGDYIGVSFAGGYAVPVFALASAPTGGTFHEAMFATAIRVRG